MTENVHHVFWLLQRETKTSRIKLVRRDEGGLESEAERNADDVEQCVTSV